MTLVLAIRCREGVVLASDGQATTDAAGQPTRLAVQKLFDLGGRIAWGAAGSVGLQQALAERLDEEEDAVLAGPDPRPALVDAVIPIQQRALRDFVPHPGAQPPDLACVFCWVDGDGSPRIFSIPRTGSDHQLHEDTPRWGPATSSRTSRWSRSPTSARPTSRPSRRRWSR